MSGVYAQLFVWCLFIDVYAGDGSRRSRCCVQGLEPLLRADTPTSMPIEFCPQRLAVRSDGEVLKVPSEAVAVTRELPERRAKLFVVLGPPHMPWRSGRACQHTNYTLAYYQMPTPVSPPCSGTHSQGHPSAFRCQSIYKAAAAHRVLSVNATAAARGRERAPGRQIAPGGL